MLTDSLVNTLVSKSGARWVVADALVEQRRRSAGAAAQGQVGAVGARAQDDAGGVEEG